ncbi:MAG: UvrD-helicase domain-containing protein [Gammaproteobacteria bacterium]
MIDDAAARARALDPVTSFAVRAPAGSGKTSLLTQRVLGLLATVDQPEQIVAITFTRKAAEEMRLRIVEALAAAQAAPPAEAFQRATWTLARAVVARDAERGWQLGRQPARLRIMTIDALCQALVRQMPLTAGLPGLPAVEDDARLLHAEAAREALASIADGGRLRDAVACLLRHLDNDWTHLETLLAGMLERRDQWLRVTTVGADRGQLEDGFRRLVERDLARLATAIPADTGRALAELGALVGAELDDPVLCGLTTLPPPALDALPAWQALGRFLLTRNGNWRSKVTRREGFPPKGDDHHGMKQRHADIVAELARVPGLGRALARLAGLAAAPYDETDWTVVLALFEVLQVAAAHLVVTADVAGRADFTAFSLAALAALGEPDQPTDLALALDYQVRHLLIDEFQDTSLTQFELVRRLTAGWQPGDGRTLFVVGDPMQSIYRFRQAEVSLFQRVLDDRAIGDIALEPLGLQVNFRAQAALVDWINEATPAALACIEAAPAHFAPQRAVRAAIEPAWLLHPTLQHDGTAEAAAVVDLVQRLRGEDANASIAVLVRSRGHLGSIVMALQAAGVPLAAREIRRFLEVPVVADLVALSRALLHDADRLAWLAVLRAPWCGLDLAALETLAAAPATLAAALAEPALVRSLGSDAAPRAARVAGILAAARERLVREPFADVVETTWIALGGPAVVCAGTGGAADLEHARALFDELVRLDRGEAELTAGRLLAHLADRFAVPTQPDGHAVQVMTVHRAKGLEFDHVILPGLGRTPRAEDKPLLAWREELDQAGRPALVVAPLPRQRSGPLYDYLRASATAEAREEAVRLLYVALTRARRQVHLFGHAARDTSGLPVPRQGSFLALLWPAVGAAFRERVASLPDVGSTVGGASVPPAPLLRAAADALPAWLPPPPATPPGEAAVEFDWAGIDARHVGTVTHRLLQDWGQRRERPPLAVWLETARGFARAQLRALGMAAARVDDAVEEVIAGLAAALAGERARWLFEPGHAEAAAELALGWTSAGEVRRLVIDRTFVDAAGTRWIVDFKTGTHAGGDLPGWLDAEQARYRPQLERYAAAMAALEPRPIRLGLFFPLVDGWREWPYGDA